MSEIEKISNKNNVLLISFLTIFLFTTLGAGIYINLEINNLWLNYNILLNSLLENTRSLYLGFNDGMLQFYSCDDNIKPEIKLEMSDYLNTIPSIIFSFPFSFCLSNFDFKDIVSNTYYKYLSADKESWIIHSFQNFYDIVESIEKCMGGILSTALAQESAFLLQPIIDSKRQIWALHQNMGRYSINRSNEEFPFGQNSLLCNYSVMLDVQGSPKITGVIINGSEYQAPLFKVSIKSLTKDHLNFTVNESDSIIEETEEIDNKNIYLNLSRPLLDKLGNNILDIEDGFNPKMDMGGEILENSDGLEDVDNLRAILQQGRHFFVNTLNPRTLNDLDNIMNKHNALKSAFTRTIYIPTSSILSSIEVFSEGMKEIERNSSNSLATNIMFIQTLSLIMTFIALIFIMLIFVPLLAVENEKRKELFSSHGYLIVERYKHFAIKYSYEINSSLEEFYMLFEQLFNTIQKVVECKEKEDVDIHKISDNVTQKRINTKNIELISVYKQIVGIIMYKLYFIRKFSIFNSCCLEALINECPQGPHVIIHDKNIESMNLMLEMIPKLIDRNSSMIEVTTNNDYNKIENIDPFDFILICIIISNLTYSIYSHLDQNKKMKLILERKSIKLSINVEEDDKSALNSRLVLSDLLINSFGDIHNPKNINEFFEKFMIDNNWLKILIDQLNMELFIKENPGNIEIGLSIKKNTRQTIFNPREYKSRRIELSGNGLSAILVIELFNSYQNYIIEDECSKMGINFIRTKFSSLNLVPIIDLEFVVIFTEKMFIKAKENVKMISEFINKSNLREVVIFWLDENGITTECLINEFNPNKSNFVNCRLSNSIDNDDYLTKKLNVDLNYLSNNNYAENNKYINIFGNFVNTKISLYFIKKTLSRLNIQKILSTFVSKKVKYGNRCLSKYSLLQSLIDTIDNNTILQLSTKNFITNNFAFKQKSMVCIEQNCNKNKYLLNMFKIVSSNGIPIKEIKQLLSMYSMAQTNKWGISLNQKSIKSDLTSSCSTNKKLNISINQLLFISENELTHEIEYTIRDILSLSSTDMVSERIDLLMEFWAFVKRNITIKDEKLLQFYCPRLVLHCVFTLKILIKNSINLIENIAFDFNMTLALIISFISIPLIKPGISSKTISHLNEIVSICTNEIASLEVQMCSLLENIFSLPKFSKLFDDFEVSNSLNSKNYYFF